MRVFFNYVRDQGRVGQGRKAGPQVVVGLSKIKVNRELTRARLARSRARAKRRSCFQVGEWAARLSRFLVRMSRDFSCLWREFSRLAQSVEVLFR